MEDPNTKTEEPPKETEVKDQVPGSTEPNPPASEQPKETPVVKDEPTTDPMVAMMNAITGLSEKMDKVVEAVMAKTAPGDGCTADEAPKETEVQDEEPKPEEKKEPENKVGDEMPIYTQTMATVNKGASLEDTFAKMKERK